MWPTLNLNYTAKTETWNFVLYGLSLESESHLHLQRKQSINRNYLQKQKNGWREGNTDPKGETWNSRIRGMLMYYPPAFTFLGRVLSPSMLCLISNWFQVSKLGFGCMGLTFVNYPGAEEDGISIIKHAFSKGITFFDTSDVYGTVHANEILVGKVWIWS